MIRTPAYNYIESGSQKKPPHRLRGAREVGHKPIEYKIVFVVYY
jgi:hypothetical protein